MIILKKSDINLYHAYKLTIPPQKTIGIYNEVLFDAIIEEFIILNNITTTFPLLIYSASYATLQFGFIP